MSMTDQQRQAEARALMVTYDKMMRNPKRIVPSAPWIIPATMIVVTLFAIVCLVIKLFMNYLNSRSNKTKTFALSEQSSPDLPTTPTEDQASMATTASMKTRGSLRQSSKRRRNRPPAVSLYQIKQMQSPGSSTSKSRNKAAMKAISRAAKAEANRSLSRESTRQVDDGSDEMANEMDNSPTNLSQNSDDTDELQASVNQSGLVYAAARGQLDSNDGGNNVSSSQNPNQPEVHIVQIRDIEDNVQHSQPTWPQAESEI